MPTYTQIGTGVVVGAGGASEITFSSIPATYTDLVIKVSARTTRPGTDIDDELRLSFNGSTSGYTTRMLEGNGSTVRSTTETGSYFGRGTCPTDDSPSNIFGNTDYYICNYAGSGNKGVSFDTTMETTASFSYMLIVSGLWASSAAITSCSLTALGTFNQYTTAYLYGVSNA